MAKSRYNIDRLRKKFKEFEEIAKQDIKDVLDSSAQIIVNEAKRKAPANFGKLRQSISKEVKEDGFKQLIYVGEVYGVFVEFGTKTHVKVPVGFEDLALQFKGYKSGTFEEFLENIKDWCKRKGIVPSSGGVKSFEPDQQDYDEMAYLIAMSIIKKGIKPQPFLIPAFTEEKPKIPEKMDKLLQRSAKEFNKD